MAVEFWDVGAATSAPLPMDIGDISRHLTADWVPSLPSADGTAFMSWPPFLIEELASYGSPAMLTLRESARRTERQWKSVLSWMLGVAGTRHFMRSDGYTWIAPLSAFYRNVAQPLDVETWPPQFPPARIIADKDPSSRSRLRPDYIALRPTAGVGGYEWAVTEAKGVSDQLAGKNTCPLDWHNQARNIALTVNETKVAVPRHLVVATRVNPNAVNASTRRIQIRAWNRKQDLGSESQLPPEAAIDIASAHLFGLLRALRLRDNALAIALSVQRRADERRAGARVFRGIDRQQETEALLQECRPRARAELANRISGATNTRRRIARVPVETDRGTVVVEIADPLLALVEKIQEAPSEEDLIFALHKADTELARFERERSADPNRSVRSHGPIGIEVLLPNGFTRP
jgi:hypothetical protein